MKNRYILFVCILLIGFVSAHQGYGGSYNCARDYDFCDGDFFCNKTTEQCEINMSSFTGCLIENCDYFCNSMYGGKGQGEYYKEDKCWCEEIEYTSRGFIIIDDGWIRVDDCELQPKITSLSNEDIKIELKKGFIIIIKSMFTGLIIGLSIVCIYHMYKWNKKEANGKVE